MVRIGIPMAIQVVIDDVGWWSGKNEGHINKPFRTGIQRDHVPMDYQAIIDLGKKLGIRPQAAMIMCEWDRTNLLKTLSSSTWMGEGWDNTNRVIHDLDETVELFNNNNENIELVLHGIGHEYWTDGVMSRAEWYDKKGHMRPEEEVRLHLEYFLKLLRQNGFEQTPESFVPAAFLYKFSQDEFELASILKDFGIKYISTPYSTMFNSSSVQGKYFGVEHEIITVNRGHDLCNWYRIGPELSGDITGPVCGMHWPNLLHEEPDKNIEEVTKWINLLKKQEEKCDRILGKNTKEAFSQLIYHEKTLVDIDGNKGIVKFNFDETDKMNAMGLLDYFYVKTDSDILLKPVDASLISMEFNAKKEQLKKDVYTVYKVIRNTKRKNGNLRYDYRP